MFKVFMQRQRQTGFTLIELVITIAIVGLLAAIAVPAYQKYIQKGRRVDARNALLDLAAREEKYFAVNNQYTDSAPALGYGATASFSTGIAITSGAKTSYTLTVTLPATGQFSASAAPSTVQTTDACGTFTLNYLGLQGNTGVIGTPTDCW